MPPITNNLKQITNAFWLLPNKLTKMYEHYFQCPYCWEEISMLLDPSISYQVYVEDCEVCCNPIELHPRFEEQELVSFEAISIEQ